uniref:Testis-expressed protein 36 isoform X2 n=1 Tax=Phascolarctos cinereus TaxID=38626 RepID=A0A6P5JDX0_PHACI|nr:testis-expressed protein 36 isoform X2 [Phascolarctos cinereus]
MERPEPSSAAESSLTSWSTSGSPASTATPVSPAFTATPVVSPASTAIPVVLPASTATPVVSLASAATLVVSPASAAISVISPASTATSSASAATPAAQAHPTLPSSSLVYSQVSRIIASRKQRAGIWFPHLGLIEKTPESTTTAMLKQPFLPESKRKMEERLPSRYQLRQQQANKSSFPFSVHDNRRGLEFCGHGLDEEPQVGWKSPMEKLS